MKRKEASKTPSAKGLFKAVRTPSFKGRPKRKRKVVTHPEQSHANAGRPKKDINWVLVKRLAKIHCTPSEIAATLDVNESTLTGRREFPAIYKKGWENGRKSLRRMQWEAAEKGNIIMQIFLGKQLLGQADRWVGEVGGTNGGTMKLEVSHRPDLSKLTTDELMVLKAIVSKATTTVKSEAAPPVTKEPKK